MKNDIFSDVSPNSLSGRYLRTFWQPVFKTADLKKGLTKPLRILGEDFTLYRGDSGAAHIVGDRCPHRGAKLSVGWVEEDCIRCFYHGWKFSSSGECTEQPAEPKPFLNEIKVRSVPTYEYLGLIFGFFGDGSPPEKPRFDNFERGGFIDNDCDYRNYNFFQDFENGMDRVHAGFVHRTLPGSFDGREDSPQVTAVEDDWGLKTIARHPSGRVGIQSFGMPNKQHIIFTFGNREMITWKVPIDNEHTAHLRISLYRNREEAEEFHASREAKREVEQFDPMELAKEVVAGRLHHDDVDPRSTNMVAFQDNIVLLAQGVIVDRSNEFLGASDAPVVLLRRIWSREMKALEEDRPLKKWKYNPDDKLQNQ